MAEDVAQLQVEFVAKMDALITALDKVGKRVEKTQRDTTKHGSKMQRVFREVAASIASVQGPLGPLAGRLNALGSAIGRVGLVGAGAGALIAGMTVAMKKALTAAAEYNREVNKLGAIVKATGSAAGFTAGEIDKFAIQLGESTMTSASAAREAAGIILTFKSITGDTFKQTLSLAQDLSEAGFGSLRETSKQLAKALEEPIEGLTALRRSGVTFTEAQKEMIKSLVESGNKAKAQQIILKAVNEQVGGTGVAAAKGLAGALDTLGERVERAWAAIGNTAPIQLATDGINALSDAINKVLKPSQDAAEAQSKFKDYLKPNAEALKLFGVYLDNMDPSSLEQVDGAIKRLAASGIDLKNKNKAQLDLQIRSLALFQKLVEQNKGLKHAQEQYAKALADGHPSLVTWNDQILRYNKMIDETRSKLTDVTDAMQKKAKKDVDAANAIRAEEQAQKDLDREFELAMATEKEVIKTHDEHEKRLQSLIAASNPLSEAIKKQADNIDFLMQKMESGQLDPALFQEMMAGMAFEMPETPEDKMAQKAKEAAEKKLEKLNEAYMSEEELLLNHMLKELDIINEAQTQKIISEEDAADKRLQIQDRYHKSKKKLDEVNFSNGLKFAGQFFNGMMTLTQNSNKGAFKVAKAGAKATALIDTYKSAQAAFSSQAGIPIVGPVLGAAAAAAAIVAGLARVKQINAVQFGGGGGGGGAAAGGGATGTTATAPSTTTQPEVAQQAPTGTRISVSLGGDEDELVSKQAIRNLINKINAEIADGAEIDAIRVV